MKEPYLIPIESSLEKQEALVFIDGYLSQEANQAEDNGHWWWTIRKAGWKGSIYHLWWDASEFNTLLQSGLMLGFGAITHWQKHKAQAKKVGIEYAPKLFTSLPEKTVSLVGFSLGSRVAYYMMRDWSESSVELRDVVLMDGAIRRGNSKDWGLAVSHITGQLLNIYNSNDLVLKTLCKALELNRSSCGIKPIKESHSRIINIDATKAMNTSDHSGGSYRRIFEKAVGRKLWS